MARGLIGPLTHVVFLLIGNLIFRAQVADCGLFPEIESVTVVNVTSIASKTFNNVDDARGANGTVATPPLKRVEFEMRGKNFFGGMRIAITRLPRNRNQLCERPQDYQIGELYVNECEARLWLELPASVQEVFFCIPHYEQGGDGIFWYHQGADVALYDLDNSEEEETKRDRHQ